MEFIYVRANSDDRSIWTSVVDDDEYRVDDLKPEDIVLDIGMHTGSFCHRAWLAGSRSIYGFEVDEDNFRLAQANLHGRAQVFNLAVVRSDARSNEPLYYTGHIQMEHGEDTGTGTVFGLEGRRIPTIPFDTILGQLGYVRLVKMDCEGSEWPILFTSQRLANVEEFVGEWHRNHPLIERQFGLKPCNLTTLAEHMENAGFEVRFYQRAQDVLPGAIPNPVGNFHFIRRDKLTPNSFSRDLEGRARICEWGS